MASRQLPAASRNSRLLNSTCMSFSASTKVAAVTSGPTGTAAAKVEGSPGGATFCARATSCAPMEAPTTPRDALVKKRLRELFDVFTDFPFILNYLVVWIYPYAAYPG